MKLSRHKIDKIAVFRALYLGDLLCAVPALKVLRNGFPASEISLIGLPWAASFASRFSAYIDHFIPFPGCPGLPEQAVNEDALMEFRVRMQKSGFDLILQMQGNGTVVNALVEAFGAKVTAGFYPATASSPNSPYFIPYPEDIPEVCRHLQLMEALGLSVAGRQPLEFPIFPEDVKDTEAFLPALTQNPFVCIHPGSRSPARRWPPKYFAAIGDYCVKKRFTVVLTGTVEEMALCREVRKFMHHDVIDLSGMTSLGGVGMLIREAVLLVSNCTGVSHVADAMQTPSFIISMDGEPRRWAPRNASIHHVYDWRQDPHFGHVFQQAAAWINELPTLACYRQC